MTRVWAGVCGKDYDTVEKSSSFSFVAVWRLNSAVMVPPNGVSTYPRRKGSRQA